MVELDTHQKQTEKIKLLFASITIMVYGGYLGWVNRSDFLSNEASNIWSGVVVFGIAALIAVALNKLLGHKFTFSGTIWLFFVLAALLAFVLSTTGLIGDNDIRMDGRAVITSTEHPDKAYTVDVDLLEVRPGLYNTKTYVQSIKWPNGGYSRLPYNCSVNFKVGGLCRDDENREWVVELSKKYAPDDGTY